MCAAEKSITLSCRATYESMHCVTYDSKPVYMRRVLAAGASKHIFLMRSWGCDNALVRVLLRKIHEISHVVVPASPQSDASDKRDNTQLLTAHAPFASDY